MSGISISCKVGDKRYPEDPDYFRQWRSGQIIDIRPIGYYDQCVSSRMFNCIIDCPNIDFDELRGVESIQGEREKWKSSKQSVFDNWKKYLYVADSNGKYRWDFGYLEGEEKARERDWFIDFAQLRDLGFITQSTYEAILDYERVHPPIVYDGNIITNAFHHEDGPHTRILPAYKNQPYSSGTHTIGAVACDATDIADAYSKTTDLSGYLYWEVKDEEISESSSTDWNLDYGAYTLYIWAESGAEHNGYQYASGARLNYSSNMAIGVDSSSVLARIRFHNLAIDASGSANDGISFRRSVTGSSFIVDSILMIGDSSADKGITHHTDAYGEARIYNNIVYGFSSSLGININNQSSSITNRVYNNTCVGNSVGINQTSSSLSGVAYASNNLCQGNTTDYGTAGAGWTVSAKNVSEDSTSPDDDIYDDLNCHDGNSCFQDYSSNNYLLDSGGDEISTLDNGDNISGYFSHDIIGNTRSTWYIGAHELSSTTPITKTIGDDIVNEWVLL